MALDTLDFWTGTMLIFVLAMIQSFLYAWVLGIDRGEKEAHEGAHLRIPRFVQYVLKYVTPLYLLTIFVGVMVTEGLGYWKTTPGPPYWKTLTTDKVAGLSFGLICLVFVFLLITVHIAGRRWRAQGRLPQSEPFA